MRGGELGAGEQGVWSWGSGEQGAGEQGALGWGAGNWELESLEQGTGELGIVGSGEWKAVGVREHQLLKIEIYARKIQV